MDLSDLQCLDASDALEAVSADGADDRDRTRMLRAYLVTHYANLHRRLLRRLGCPDLASDCLHDAWLRLESQALPVSVQNPEAYVYRVACNVAVDALRGARPWQYAADAEAELAGLADQTPGPEVVAQARSDLASFERALARLPRRHRTVLVALRIDEMTRQEVAARYGLSLRTVDTALRQALDYCAGHSRQEVRAGVSGARRALRYVAAAA